MTGSAAALHVVELAKSFGGVRALNGVTIEVAPGEVLGLLGPNGSGKTTLVNCISGVLEPTGGRVQLQGRDVTRWSRSRRARAGLVRTYQNLRLFGDLTVAENVEVGLLGGRVAGGADRRERVLAALRAQDLIGLERETVRELSYGQQRRVEIARALVARPRMLLLDEPAAGLGEEETAELRATIANAREDLGCGVILIDHDVSFVLGISDRVIVLHEGALLRSGSPDEIRDDPTVAEVYLGAAEVAA